MTRFEFYKTLPHNIFLRAFRNTDKDMLMMTCASLGDAISGGFEWDESREGFQFWKHVVESVWRMEEDLQKALQLINDGHAIQS